MDELTSEELMLIIDDQEIIKEYDLLNLYSVTEKGPAPLCSSCGIILKKDGTYVNYSRCTPCSREYQREYIKRNKEKVREYSKKYRQARADLYRQYIENGF